MTTHKNPGQNEIFASTVRLLMYPRARGECYVCMYMYVWRRTSFMYVSFSCQEAICKLARADVICAAGIHNHHNVYVRIAYVCM